jgi:biopolymer transport protein ExbB/TolQ
MIHRTFYFTALLSLQAVHATNALPPIDNARAALTKSVTQLQSAQKEYADLRRALYKDVNRLDDEALNLAKELRTLEREEELRTSKVKALDRDLDTRKNGFIYTSGVLNQYSKAIISRIHPAEYQLYSQNISELDQKASKLSGDPKSELIERLKVLEIGIKRLGVIAGGHRFEGKALGFAGRSIPGTLFVAGPSVFFASADKSIEGISPPADTGSGLPAVVSINKSNGSIAQTIAAGKGDLPLDGTMGKAIQAEVKHPGGQNKAMEHIMLFGDIAKNMMFDGWIAIAVCVLMIAIGWSVAIKKIFYLNSIHKGSGEFLRQWRLLSSDLTAIDHADDDSIRSFGGNADPAAQAMIRKSPFYQIYHIGSEEISHRLAPGPNQATGLTARSIQAIRSSLDAGLVQIQHKLTDGLVYLTISIAGGPYVGLLGTVVGVMITFAIISKEGEVNVNAIAPGIASALLATVAGLVVAIPALFVYSYLNGRIKNTTAEIQVFIDEFVAKMAEFYPSPPETTSNTTKNQ